MMPSSGRRKVLNAAATRAGLAIQSMSSARRGKRPPNNANKQPILIASCLVLLRQLQRGCLVRVADQAALAASGVAIHRSVFSVRFFVCLLPPCMTPLEHKPRHGGASSPKDMYPLGDILSHRPGSG